MIEFKKFQGRDLFYGGKIFPHSKEIERFVSTLFTQMQVQMTEEKPTTMAQQGDIGHLQRNLCI